MNNITEKESALRRMKFIATSAFVIMLFLFIATFKYVNIPAIGYLNSFAEAAMVGALADWFAVVALFRYPLGIPIWHTAIIPRKKQEISKNLATFVETRLLSIDNIQGELKNVSASDFIDNFLSNEENKAKIVNFVCSSAQEILLSLNDEEIKTQIADFVSDKLNAVEPAPLLAQGIEVLVQNKHHEKFISSGIVFLADWLPTHKERIKIIIENYLEKILKWGSNLVPDSFVENITDKAIETLIEQLAEAKQNPKHPIRNSIEQKVTEFNHKLRHDPSYGEQLVEWKNSLINNPELQSSITGIWDKLKSSAIDDLQSGDSKIKRSVADLLTSFQEKLKATELKDKFDNAFRTSVVSVLQSNHSAIGGMITKVIDSWDGEKLSKEIEVNLGRDLQFIRLNGTIIGGIIGVILHFLTNILK